MLKMPKVVNFYHVSGACYIAYLKTLLYDTVRAGAHWVLSLGLAPLFITMVLGMGRKPSHSDYALCRMAGEEDAQWPTSPSLV